MIATWSQAKSLPLALDKPVLVKHQFRLKWAPVLVETPTLARFSKAESVQEPLFFGVRDEEPLFHLCSPLKPTQIVQNHQASFWE